MFPDHIPLPRGNAAVLSSILVMVASFSFMFSCSKASIIVQHILFHLFILFLSRSIQKLCEFLEECRHIPSRYKNCWKAFAASVSLKECGSGAVILILLCCLAHESENDHVDNWSSLGWKISSTCFCYSLLRILGFYEPTTAQISAICEKNKFNVAHGLAWSYYIGYLKLILPSLEGRIKEYHRTFENLAEFRGTWKLYILIPFNCKVYDKLEKMDNRIKFLGNLPELRIDRAGIKERSYKNSIYSVYDENQMCHLCILEYATPLRSLFEMSNDATAALSKEQRLEQAKLFYVTLDNILNNSQECAGLYKLIPYDDDLEDRKMNSHFLSTKILDNMVQERTEYIVPEENTWDETLNDPMVSDQALMISESNDPQPLQSRGY
ncbi:stimulator of interferon genes protein [Pristis pectinata]|uniref:stimulator of interferon genes protein n=1 Tax=Pristis pectinata TaxID=685728 RepID=UPI00223D4ECB|nr:stimulator of interferon genes protein [Pristis pectinata]XP_051871003.1 stimulator of interferon genes protein [Pristis pectinata]